MRRHRDWGFAPLAAELASLAGDAGEKELSTAGLSICRFDRHAAPDWRWEGTLTLFVVLSGAMVVSVEERRLTVEPGMYFLYQGAPKVEVLEGNAAAPFLSLALRLSPSTLAEIVVDQPRGSWPLPASPADSRWTFALSPQIGDALLRLLQLQRDEAERSVLGPLVLREIAFRLYRRHPDLVGVKVRYERYAQKVMAAMKIMQADLRTPLTIPQLARRVGASTSSLAHGFKSIVGMSPHQFLRQMRLERARVMIIGEGVRISEAAHRIGYSSSSHFVNEFKKHFGECPSEYLRHFRRHQERDHAVQAGQVITGQEKSEESRDG